MLPPLSTSVWYKLEYTQLCVEHYKACLQFVHCSPYDERAGPRHKLCGVGAARRRRCRCELRWRLLHLEGDQRRGAAAQTVCHERVCARRKTTRGEPCRDCALRI